MNRHPQADGMALLKDPGVEAVYYVQSEFLHVFAFRLDDSVRTPGGRSPRLDRALTPVKRTDARTRGHDLRLAVKEEPGGNDPPKLYVIIIVHSPPHCPPPPIPPHPLPPPDCFSLLLGDRTACRPVRPSSCKVIVLEPKLTVISMHWLTAVCIP